MKRLGLGILALLALAGGAAVATAADSNGARVRLVQRETPVAARSALASTHSLASGGPAAPYAGYGAPAAACGCDDGLNGCCEREYSPLDGIWSGYCGERSDCPPSRHVFDCLRIDNHCAPACAPAPCGPCAAAPACGSCNTRLEWPKLRMPSWVHRMKKHCGNMVAHGCGAACDAPHANHFGQPHCPSCSGGSPASGLEDAILQLPPQAAPPPEVAPLPEVSPGEVMPEAEPIEDLPPSPSDELAPAPSESAARNLRSWLPIPGSTGFPSKRNTVGKKCKIGCGGAAAPADTNSTTQVREDKPRIGFGCG